MGTIPNNLGVSLHWGVRLTNEHIMACERAKDYDHDLSRIVAAPRLEA